MPAVLLGDGGGCCCCWPWFWKSFMTEAAFSYSLLLRLFTCSPPQKSFLLRPCCYSSHASMRHPGQEEREGGKHLTSCSFLLPDTVVPLPLLLLLSSSNSQSSSSPPSPLFLSSSSSPLSSVPISSRQVPYKRGREKGKNEGGKGGRSSRSVLVVKKWASRRRRSKNRSS